MEVYFLNAHVDFNGKPVNFSTPIIVDDEIYELCRQDEYAISAYYDNTDMDNLIADINEKAFLGKTDAWRNIVAPISPYAGIDTFDFFSYLLPNIYNPPEGFAPAPNTSNIRYDSVLLSDGTEIYNGVINARFPPKSFTIRGASADGVAYRGGFIDYLGASLDNPYEEAFRRSFQYDLIVLNSGQIVNGKINLSKNPDYPAGYAEFGRVLISFDKERVAGKLDVLVTLALTNMSTNATIDFWNGKPVDPLVPPPPTPDPSGPGGGGGTLDDTSDPIDFPDPPALTASATGMLRLYSPTVVQLQSLSRYMWSDEFNLDTFKKLFADPMDVIIGLSIVPVTPALGPTETIKIGFVDTGVNCTTVESQYVTVDCGTLDIKEFFGTALDYSPYTRFSLYLPYIGAKELKTDDIMGRVLNIRYTVDILSGACTAHIKCGDSVLYQYSGSCSTTIPITSQNWSQLITSIIQLAGAGIATAASGGSAAPLLPAAANTVFSAKPTIQRAGAVSGAAGFLGIQYPYLIWEHPRQSLPTGYNKFVGYPSNITQELGALTGFTQIESIHLEGIPATQTELTEIESLLKEGVIF